MIKENLAYVEEQIARACERAGRNREDVTLIAVSKTKPLALVEETMDCGIKEFGENKVQEIMDKYETVKLPVNWHMIGHLQRNKAKYIVDKVCLIHSVDSYRLAETINQEAAKKNVICDILIEVNIAKEDTKFGAMEEEVLPLIEQISKLSNIRIKGLMTIAPFVENSEKNRVHFRNLRNLCVDIKTKNIDNVDMKILSMGMTNDYEVAIEEGATMVRVGTGIFGERD
ncbi:YggS family pyridoxal phosphate-dependent enzyme [Anaerosporobacter sp.]|uniref:YggS family pyridoxal phosphate-dependent enzyme n=1 Tax=Anaerosporobacter sp. TaxID=1872529 RepID=UPI00286F4050|nr:YggS family pyridoxal phosphate-dependent enzyme [Anaerosporobacter sp.]